MLQQIFNITNNPDLNKSKKFKGYRELKKERHNTPGKEYDSASFSAASQFLSKVNWNITNLSYEETDEFVISFTADDYLFNIKFELHKIKYHEGIYLEVIKKFNDQKQVVISNLIPYNILRSDTHEVIGNFEALAVLCTRLEYLADEDGARLISDGFYEDLISGLNDELGSLCSMVIIFAEKLLSVKLWNEIEDIANLTFNDKIIVQNAKIR